MAVPGRGRGRRGAEADRAVAVRELHGLRSLGVGMPGCGPGSWNFGYSWWHFRTRLAHIYTYLKQKKGKENKKKKDKVSKYCK